MRTKLFLTANLLLFLTAIHVCAQDTLFIKKYGNNAGNEEMEVLIGLSDSSLLIAGNTDSYGGGDGDLLIIKTDINGSIQWSKIFSGALDEMATDVKETADSGFIVAGWTESFGASGYDVWILKLDKNGNIQWQKRYGGNGDEQAWSVSVDNNAYFVVGGTNSFGAGLTDLWALKLDFYGNIIWQKTYGSIGDDAPPGAYDEYVAKGLINKNGNYMICGMTDSVGHGGTDFYLAEINSANGNIIWQYAYGDVDDESIWSFAESPKGGYILPGNTINPNTYEGDLWMLYLDTAGTIKWQKTFGISNLWDEALNINVLDDGSIVLASYFEQSASDWTASALKTDINGNLIWAKKFKTGDLDWTNAVWPLNDNTLAFVGVTTDTVTWDEDIILLRTNDMGMVPGCNFINSFSPAIVNTATTRQSINLSVNNTNVNPVNTSATMQNISISTSVPCSEIINGVNSEQKQNDKPLFYPNPTNGDLILKFDKPENQVVTILRNQLGREINRKTWRNVSSLKLKIDGSEGIYFLELFYGDDDRKILKLLKIR